MTTRKRSSTGSRKQKLEVRDPPMYTLSELDAVKPKDRPFFVRRDYIEHGYRAGHGTGMSFKQCTESLFGYIHNESMNIYSHLVPALYFTVHMLINIAGMGDYSVL